MFSAFCLSKNSVKIVDATEDKKPAKSKTACGICSGEKSIITLDCHHKCCVKCFNKIRYCVQCKNEKAMCGC
jgi:hypothetical protein